MVRLLALAVAAVAAFTSPSTTEAGSIADLLERVPKGIYYRPTGNIVSGRVDNAAPIHRSPCPALNSMANHGFLPRDGKEITRAILKSAVMEYFNIAEDLADVMISLSPDAPSFTLATLSTHNLIEHDVSLSRRDTYFGGDQSLADPAYLKELLAPGAVDRVISLKDVAAVRGKRTAECKGKNPECDYGDQQQFIADAESGLLLRAMGAQNSEAASYANVYSFFVDEKFPPRFVKSKMPITFADLSATIENIRVAQA